MLHQGKACSSFLALLLVSGWYPFALAQAPANRISGRIDEAQVTTLLGNVHPMARGEFDEGVINGETLWDR